MSVGEEEDMNVIFPNVQSLYRYEYLHYTESP